jgi:aminoglycoside phosphotransferase (APT) family kinase protein
VLESAPLDERTRADLLRRLEGTPAGGALYHGDLHPGNVILAERGSVVIDWVNALRVHPAADVARSWVLMRYQGTKRDPTGRRAGFAERYRDAYFAAGTISRAGYDVCLSNAAWALLRAQPENPHREELERLVAS